MEDKTIELDFRTITVKDSFNENDNVKEAYFKSVTIGEWINRFEDRATPQGSNSNFRHRVGDGDAGIDKIDMVLPT